MKRTLAIIAAILLLPFTVSAAPTTWDYASGVLQPLQSMWSANVKVPYITATSTNASTFAGSVGIGSSTPYAKLSVTNTGSIPSFIVEDSTNDQSPFVIDASGNVGIGTTSPALLVDIRASDSGTGLLGGNTPQISIVNTNTTNNNYSSLNFGQINSAGTRATTVRLAGVQTNHTNGAEAGNLAILTTTGGSIAERMRVTAAGNVGIGTTTPSSALQVYGTSNTAVITTPRVQYFGSMTDTGALIRLMGITSSNNVSIGAIDSASGQVNFYQDGAATFNLLGNNAHVVNRLGVNESTPDYRTEILGSTGSGYLGITNSTDGDIFTINTAGLVGIGTTSPMSALAVAGTITANNINATSTSATSVFSGILQAIAGLIIPNGTNPTADDPGEIAHDTTDNQLILDDRVIRTGEEIYKFAIGSTSPSFAQGASKRLPFLNDGYTVTNILCDVEGGTSKAITLYGETITCDLDGATDDGSIASPTIAANASTTITMATTTGSVNYVNVTIKGTWTRE